MISSSEIINIQELVTTRDDTEESLSQVQNLTQNRGIYKWIEKNHFFNSKLWAEEDLARRNLASDKEIAQNKRNIDQYNQKRNDAVEMIDEIFLASVSNIKISTTARQHSETAGLIVDRLSILSLKISAMQRESERSTAGDDHVLACNRKLGTLLQQKEDLAQCLDSLVKDIYSGVAYYKIYRQHKMYNIPELNPEIYNEAATLKNKS